jgi:hypothetical protein
MSPLALPIRGTQDEPRQHAAVDEHDAPGDEHEPTAARGETTKVPVVSKHPRVNEKFDATDVSTA